MKNKIKTQLNLKHKLSEIDFFGSSPQFHINGYSKQGSPPGGVISIVLVFIYLAYFLSLIIAMVTYDNLQTF